MFSCEFLRNFFEHFFYSTPLGDFFLISLHVYVVMLFLISFFNYSNSKPSVLLFDNNFFIEAFLENKTKKNLVVGWLVGL